MTTATAQTAARNGAELGDLRNSNSDAARQGAVERNELPSLVEATLERMGELVEAGYYRDARQIHRREFEQR